MSLLCYDCSKLFYTNEYWLKNVNVLAHMFVVHAYFKLQSKWYRHTCIYIYILVFQSAINMHHSTAWRSEAPSRISACCARRRLFGSEHFALHRLHLNSIWFICRFSWFKKGEVFKRPENIVLNWGITEMFFLLMALPCLGTLTRKITLFIDYPCQFVIWIWHRHTCIQF